MAVRQDASSGQLIDDGIRKEHSAPTLHVKVYSPFQVFFDQDATTISGTNATGPFDILPEHHNFITLLEPCELVIGLPQKDKQQKIRISSGIMHVKANKVTVFLDV